MFQNNRAAVPHGVTERRKQVGHRIIGLAVVSSFVLAVAAVVDQWAGQSLAAYTVSMYGAHGIEGEPEAIYGLVHIIAGTLIVLWLLVGLASWSRRRWTFGVLVTVTTVNALLALTMLFVTEYGEPIFPAPWGAMAALPVVVGTIAATLLTRRRRGTGSAALP